MTERTNQNISMLYAHIGTPQDETTKAKEIEEPKQTKTKRKEPESGK